MMKEKSEFPTDEQGMINDERKNNAKAQTDYENLEIGNSLFVG